MNADDELATQKGRSKVRPGTGLTIQDYFERANIRGLKTRRFGQARTSADAGKATIETGDFSRALDKAHATQGSQARPLSIGDYLRNPVRSRRLARRPLPAMPQPPNPVPVPSAATSSNPSTPTVAAANAVSQLTPQRDYDIIRASIKRAAADYDLSPALINAVIRAESNFQVRAVSPAGAQGLMQLMPETANELGVQDPFDIEQNIDGGARYLRGLLNQFDGDLKLALSAYNAGPGTVAKYNGRVPYAETRTYVARVMRYAKAFPDPLPNRL